MVELDFKENVNFKIYPYIQCSEEAKVKMLSNNAFDEKIREINNTIIDHTSLNKKCNNYYSLLAKTVSNAFEPVQNRIYWALKKRNLCPSLISQRNRIKINNLISCESHRDIVLYYLHH